MTVTMEQLAEAVTVEVSKLELGPNDTLVLRVPMGRFRRAEDMKCWLEELEAKWRLFPRGRVIILPEEIKLAVVHQ